MATARATGNRATGNHRVETEVGGHPVTESGGQPVTESGGQPVTENGDIARQARDQVVSTIQQGQQVSIEAAQTWVEALTALPVRRIPVLAGLLAFPMQGAEAMTRFYFDVAADLLDAQREYVLHLVRLFSPQEPV